MWREPRYWKAIILQLKINKYILKKERGKKKWFELSKGERPGQGVGAVLSNMEARAPGGYWALESYTGVSVAEEERGKI